MVQVAAERHEIVVVTARRCGARVGDDERDEHRRLAHAHLVAQEATAARLAVELRVGDGQPLALEAKSEALSLVVAQRRAEARGGRVDLDGQHAHDRLDERRHGELRHRRRRPSVGRQ